MFPQNMYVLNRYANYPNGNQEGVTASISRPVPISFSCNTSQTLVMKHSVLCVVVVCCPFCGWKLNVPFASNWSDTTTGWYYQLHFQSRAIKMEYAFFLVNARVYCVSQTCWCGCNWNEHRVNETSYPPRTLHCFTSGGPSLVTVYTSTSTFLLQVCVCVNMCTQDVIQHLSSSANTNSQKHMCTHRLVLPCTYMFTYPIYSVFISSKN